MKKNTMSLPIKNILPAGYYSIKIKQLHKYLSELGYNLIEIKSTASSPSTNSPSNSWNGSNLITKGLDDSVFVFDKQREGRIIYREASNTVKKMGHDDDFVLLFLNEELRIIDSLDIKLSILYDSYNQSEDDWWTKR